MKIEKVNDHQIRCTLTKEDLADREIKLSELAYGTDKAKDLFRDMMQQASFELGFEAEDTPLMIEAIPISAECIVLIVTKVDNPEELDTRFSRFSPSDSDDDDSFDFDDIETIDSNNYSSYSLPKANEELDESAATEEENNSIPEDDLMNILDRVKEYFNKESTGKKIDKAEPPADKPAPEETVSHITRVFSFDSLDDISSVSRIIDRFYHDNNSVYKNPSDKRYYLTISKNKTSAKDFNKVCNILSEYGKKENQFDNYTGFFSEHCDCIVKDHAMHILCRL